MTVIVKFELSSFTDSEITDAKPASLPARRPKRQTLLNKRDDIRKTMDLDSKTPIFTPVEIQVEKLRVLDSQHLLLGEAEVGILHENAVYRLRVTKQGKLILNK